MSEHLNRLHQHQLRVLEARQLLRWADSERHRYMAEGADLAAATLRAMDTDEVCHALELIGNWGDADAFVAAEREMMS